MKSRKESSSSGVFSCHGFHIVLLSSRCCFYYMNNNHHGVLFLCSLNVISYDEVIFNILNKKNIFLIKILSKNVSTQVLIQSRQFLASRTSLVTCQYIASITILLANFGLLFLVEMFDQYSFAYLFGQLSGIAQSSKTETV